MHTMFGVNMGKYFNKIAYIPSAIIPDQDILRMVAVPPKPAIELSAAPNTVIPTPAEVTTPAASVDPKASVESVKVLEKPIPVSEPGASAGIDTGMKITPNTKMRDILNSDKAKDLIRAILVTEHGWDYERQAKVSGATMGNIEAPKGSPTRFRQANLEEGEKAIYKLLNSKNYVDLTLDKAMLRYTPDILENQRLGMKFKPFHEDPSIKVWSKTDDIFKIMKKLSHG